MSGLLKCHVEIYQTHFVFHKYEKVVRFNEPFIIMSENALKNLFKIYKYNN